MKRSLNEKAIPKSRGLRALALVAGSLVFFSAPLDVAASPEEKISFARDIRPILSDNCFACHGPDEKQRQVDLRLDTREGAFADRGGYQVIVPGDPKGSRLYQRISHEHELARMPPPGFERDLTEEEIERIRRWIEQGAEWETHWAYVAPKRPAPPKVKKQDWVRNPIDAFVLARLESEGLEPSPEADKATLLRRLSLDLTGLPPTPEKLETFLADGSANAYEKQVDRLLQSPRFGERMAMQWLDLARYADTHGYHIDSHREMWRWRDWVIDAFNGDLPFDQFTIEQLAGDLLPDPAREQVLATGFNRNHMINFEGGAIPEEYQTEYVVDRVETTSTVWMAMTMGCARCHDHKYDPIKQKEFYEFFAFFNRIPEKGLDGRRGNAEPLLPLPSLDQKSELETLKERIARLEERLPEERLAELQAEWEKRTLPEIRKASRDGLVSHYEMDGHLADTSGQYHHGKVVRGEVTYSEGRAKQGASFTGETHAEFPGAAAFDSDEAFTLAFWVRSGNKRNHTVMERLDPAQGLRGFDVSFDEFVPLPDLRRGQNLHVRLIHRWPDETIHIKTRERLLQGDWHHIVLTSDGSGKASGLRLYANGEMREFEILQDSLQGPIDNARPLSIGSKEISTPFKGNLDDLRVYERELPPAEVEHLAIHDPMQPLLAAVLAECPPVAQRSLEDEESEEDEYTREQRLCEDRQERLRAYFLRHAAPVKVRQLHVQLEKLEARKEELEKAIPTTMVMREMDDPRETFVLGRGDYRNQQEEVSPDVPSWLPPLPEGAPKNRLGLAKWLVDPSHPLTARVTVNRYWQMYFGNGLVRTAEDFGSQGQAPTHPALLDWLATEFIRSGWDVKAMQRLIVTSATYRQSSRLTPELLKRDPQNHLLARGPRFRLPAEIVRDNALAVSGLLEKKVGGPGVNPYQPEGVWEDVAYGDVYSAQSYEQDHGEKLYRRSMYTFWKRTAPPPSLAVFDAPDREKCTARRARTNTPLQALVLMNDPTYVEAARALAERLLQEGGEKATDRIRYAYRLVLAREPGGPELDVLATLLDEQLDEYRAEPSAARKLLGVGESKFDPELDPVELAAWTTVASSILNLDEAITKE